MSDVQYNIESRILKGTIGEYSFHTYAGSGGRAGSKVVKQNVFLANNSYATYIGGVKSKGTHNYGPIPHGRYTMEVHESRKNWVRLMPRSGNNMHERAGFAIHGRGKTAVMAASCPTTFQSSSR